MEFYHLDPDRTLIAPVSDIPAVQNLDEVKTSEPKLDSTDDLGTDTSDDDMDTDTEIDGSEYLSFDESDIEDTYPETKAEREAREHERQLVLEAAGLIVKQDVKPPPRPPRKPKSGKRRPPPLAPERLSSNTSASSLKGLPPVPPTESETSAHLNDAFDRYEAFRYTHANANRMSVASSMDSAPPSSPTISTVSQTPSKEGESRYSSIMHFLGRKTPEAEKRLVISAPILNSPETEFSRSASPAFGSSWASLVDKSALEGIPPKERRRQEAIFELIATETAYVHDLQLVVEHFYSNMLSLLDMKAVTVVFANVEDILITNTTFMSALEERQKDCRLYIDKIGDVLRSHMSNMAVYMEYCVNQSNAIKVLQSLRDSRPDLAARLQHLRDDPAARNLDLSSYLLIPMQRITRYPLLVKQILHYTEPGGPEHTAIVDSLRAAERILAHINETIREQEGRETLREISQHLWIGQGRLDLTAPTRYMGARTLVKDGILCKAKSGRRLHAFLCSDTLVLTDATAQNLYRMPISLSEVRLKDGNDDFCFQVTLPYPRGGEAVGLRASSVRECQLWMQAIESASRKCIEAEKKASRRVSKAR
ncbi:Dbl homology domain-containing protein [Armillaria novae-zelandiae]|uniref:Dbl homology domain-containing protein n=1 Tax=Armillaria novae-zelandiae TaxID=153914 RepID=A0AA39NY41_9AGAR|nr:Dbl homology domain-containing protein [Armillaria novae-zelandiae]